MQKLDYIEKVSLIVKALRSNAFLSFYDTALQKPTTPANFSSLAPLLFDSKSNFEAIKQDSDIAKMLEILGADKIYASSNLTWLTTILNSNQVAPNGIASDERAFRFFLFHKSLITIEILNNDLFGLEQEVENNTLDEGKVIFRILSEEEGLSIDRYSKIFNLLSSLLETLLKIHGVEEEANIYLLDSGSDTNVGIETDVNTAKSLITIFKEIWDFVVNRKHYRNKMDNEALMDSLTYRAKLKAMKEENVITAEEEQEYAYLVKSRVDDLIKLNVIPKELYDKSAVKENVHLFLNSYSSKLLESRDVEKRNND